MWIVNPQPHLLVFGEPIQALSIVQVQRYLGVPLSPMKTRADVADKLTMGLENISSAPLKPQQRLYMLKTNLIPTMYHQLVLTATTKKSLTWLDRSVRAATRSWLKLPHGTPKEYFELRYFELRSLMEALELLAWSIKSHCLRPSASTGSGPAMTQWFGRC